VQLPDTTNDERVYEPITKKKLAFEVAKLVKDYIERMRVPVAFVSTDLFLIFSSPGQTGPSRYGVREHSVDEVVSRLRRVVATRALVRGICPRF